MSDDLQYTNIQHIPRKKWWLSLIEYCLADMIYHMSNNPKYLWCIKSKESLSDDLWISRRSTFNTISKLIKIWLIEKDDSLKWLKTTQLRYDEFVLECKNCTMSAKVKKDSAKIALETVQKLHPDSAKIAPYNNIDNNIDNISSKEEKEQAPEIEKSESLEIINSETWIEEKESSAKEKEYWNHDINLIIKLIKQYNNWICDWTKWEQRQYWRNLLKKLKEVKSVVDEKYTWDKFFEMLLGIISKNEYHSHKIASPKRIHKELWSLITICRQEWIKNNNNSIWSVPWI